MIRNFEKSIGAQSDKLHLPTMANYDGIEKGGRHFGGAMIKHIYASVASFFFFFYFYPRNITGKVWSSKLGAPYTDIHVYARTQIYTVLKYPFIRIFYILHI